MDILIWHQGALGDLLLAAPALLAIRRRYPAARLTGLGQPHLWRLLSATLSLAGVWDSSESRWAALFAAGPLPPELLALLAPFQAAVVFTPLEQSPIPERLRQAGIPIVHRVPSFPVAGRESVGAQQARHLAGLGFETPSEPFRLTLPENHDLSELAGFPGEARWLAVAPGSGQARKNWPLASFYEVSRALAWECRMRVLWLAGPAEAEIVPYLQALAAAQGHLLMSGAQLPQVAAALSQCRLFLGNDSGLTHLAAAVGAPKVLSLFGPTDPAVWAPPGRQVRILTGPCPKSPCAEGREINCPESQCLKDLMVAKVLSAAREMLADG